MSNTDMRGSRPLEGRIVLVTGATRGIGRALCIDLARAGAHVVALGRTQGALEELDDAIAEVGGEATLVPCDLKDGEGLDRLGAAIHARWRRLDAFVGNAGVLGPITPIGHVDPKQWEDVIAVNLTANWRLIRSLDPLLRASEAGRVVLLTSGVAHRAEFKPYWGAYAISKAGLEALARTYAAETATTSPIKVMLANPGPLRTRMRATAVPGEDPQSLQTPDAFTPRLLEMCLPSWSQTGKLYDFPTLSVKSFAGPA